MSLQQSQKSLKCWLQHLDSKRQTGCFASFLCHQRGIADSTVSWHPCGLKQPVLDGCRFQGTPCKDAGSPLPLWHRQMVIVAADSQPLSQRISVSASRKSVNWDQCHPPPPIPCVSYSTGGDPYVHLPVSRRTPRTLGVLLDILNTDWKPAPCSCLPCSCSTSCLTRHTHYLDLIVCSVLWLAG